MFFLSYGGQGFRACDPDGEPSHTCALGAFSIDEHLAFTDVIKEKTYTYVHESLHTPTLLLDGSKGVETYKYDAFGDVSVFTAKGVPRTESAYDNPYYFTGHRKLAEQAGTDGPRTS